MYVCVRILGRKLLCPIDGDGNDNDNIVLYWNVY